ncbi:MAG: radical SAM protein [Ignavibacterium sp.]|nr:MAG: radical SAM protein [Ignavibacterium sp.]
MKVFLTHGYFLEEDEKEKIIMKPYPPLGLLYISAYLDEKGIANEIFDTTFSSKNELRQKLLKTKPSYLAIYVNLMTKINVLWIIDFVRGKKELRNCIIILGGPEVRHNAKNFLEAGADYVVIGEGEETLTDLLNTLVERNSTRINDVQGIGFKDEANKIILTDDRTLIKSIDELPIADRKKIDIKQYQRVWKEYHGIDAISISTMRGCPYTCKWCSRAVYGLTYRRRSPKVVVDEIELIIYEYHPDTLWFVDDVFTINYDWMKEFCSELKERKVDIQYECITRSDRMNENIISLLKDSGCYRVWIGAESGSQRVIDYMDRRVNVDQVRDMIHLSKSYGIETGTFIMLGYPGETEEDIEETIDHLKESNPDYFTITLAYPIKGTEFYQQVETDLNNSFDWKLNTDRERVFKRTYAKQYYKQALRRVVNELNYHKAISNGRQLSLRNLNYKARSIIAKAGMYLARKI